MHVPEHPGYSFADQMTAHGYIVLAADHLGVGEAASRLHGDRVNLETMSAAAASFVAQVRSMLADGSAEFGGRRLPSTPIIGVGHSLASLPHRRDPGAASLL